MVTFAAMHISGEKLRAVLRKTRLPQRSAFHARTIAKSALSGFSSTYSRPSMTRVSLPSAICVPTPVGREEAADAAAAGADALGQRALRVELDLQLAREELALELLVLPHVAGDHLLDLLRLEQDAQAQLGRAAVVGDDGEALHALVVQGRDQVLRVAAQAEARRSSTVAPSGMSRDRLVARSRRPCS